MTDVNLAKDGLNHDNSPNKGFVGGAHKAWNKVIGYNSTEANRVGIPYVSSWDWLRTIFAHPGRKTANYFDDLFPFTKWILSYNAQWAIGDLIAGFTVGLVVVPQSLSYATVATLPLEYGLYSSFVGVVIYVLFATSKDVTIGPVAVMSLQTANVIKSVMDSHPGQYTAPVIASALAFICGVVCLGIGLLRLGWIVEFIPAPAVAGFMTGSAITIAVGQVPKLMGISGITTNGVACYEIVINTLKGLPRTKVDAAFGLGTLVFLYSIRSICNRLPRRYPKLTRACFFISVFRVAFIIILLTAIVYGWLKDKPRNLKKYPISLIGTVPAGFRHIGQPYLTTQLWSDMASQIPVSVIILLLEHIAISKSFGRINNYKIKPNQELVAIGVTNLVGPTFGAYPATGSFSRSAIKSKSGVRTPLAGWVTAVVVVVALYGVTGAFYWIPSSVLSAVIIHAVGDLIAPPSLSYRFWLVSPFEFFIFLAAVFVSIFATLEIGVYVSVAASAALLLVRIAHPRGSWIGTVRVHFGASTRSSDKEVAHRDVFVPLDTRDGLRDPSVRVDPPPPGILIYRFEEAFTYPNASHLTDIFLDKVRTETRPGASAFYNKRGDRPWNDPGPPNPIILKGAKLASCGLLKNKFDSKLEDVYNFGQGEDNRPSLKAIIFDFSSVSNVDTTSVQCLADVRQAVERYSGTKVDFYFSSITSPWVRRALLAGGFGTGQVSKHYTEVAPVVGQHDGASSPHYSQPPQDSKKAQHDIEEGIDNNEIQVTKDVPFKGEIESSSEDASRKSFSEEVNSYPQSQVSVPVIWNHDLTPFFHLDLSAALAAATGREFSYGNATQ
jgi:sodium-independent sulfate anion transporter 11